VYVTHDQVEAMTMGDRVAVLRKGVLQQVDAPQALYDNPVNVFVAGFIGSPAMNMVEAKLLADADAEGEDEGAFVQFGSTRLRLDPAVLARRPGLRRYRDRTLVVGIRPEDMEDATLLEGRDDARLRSVAGLVEALGAEVLVHFEVDAPPVITDDTRELAADPDRLAENGRAPFVARVSPRSKVVEDDTIEFVIDTTRLHFFDLHTGLAITGEQAVADNGR
jgi:multiple sugar transport system ATP-binding protein